MGEQLTAEELAAQVEGLAARVRAATIAEFRELMSQRLAEMAAGTEAADQEIRACVQGVELPDDWHPTQDYRDGIGFAAELLADPNFDF
jgi:hypothetical protein